MPQKALPPSTLNVGEAMLPDGKAVPAREGPGESSRTPSIAIILALTDCLFYLISQRFQLQFLIRSEVCPSVYSAIEGKEAEKINQEGKSPGSPTTRVKLMCFALSMFSKQLLPELLQPKRRMDQEAPEGDAQLVDLTSYRLFHDGRVPGQLLAAGHQLFGSLLSLQSKDFDSSIFLSDRYRLLEKALTTGPTSSTSKQQACPPQDAKLVNSFKQAKQPQLPQPLLIRLVLQTLHQLRCPSLDMLQHLNVSLVVRGPKLNTVFETKQSQLPQPLLTRLLLQTLHQLRCPSLDTLQHLNVPLVVGGPKLNTAFEVRPHQCRVQGDHHFPSPAGHAIFDTSQDAIGFLGHLGTLLAHTQPAVNQHPQVLLCLAAFQPLFPKPVVLHGVAVAQVQDLALGLVEPHTIHPSPSIQPVQVPLQSLPPLKQINTPTQLDVVCKLTEGALDPFIQIMDKDIKQNWPQHRALGNTACDRPLTGVNSIHHHSLGPAIQPVLYPAKSTPVQAMSSQFLQENAVGDRLPSVDILSSSRKKCVEWKTVEWLTMTEERRIAPIAVNITGIGRCCFIPVIKEENITHMTVRRQLSTTQPLAHSPCALCTEHDAIWYGTALWAVWINCPGCVPSQLLGHLAEHGELGKKVLDKCKYRLATAKTSAERGDRTAAQLVPVSRGEGCCGTSRHQERKNQRLIKHLPPQIRANMEQEPLSQVAERRFSSMPGVKPAISLPVLADHCNPGNHKGDMVYLHHRVYADSIHSHVIKENLHHGCMNTKLAKQPQLPQPLPIRLVLQTLHQLRCPSLETLQHVNVSLVVRGPKLNTVFELYVLGMTPYEVSLKPAILNYRLAYRCSLPWVSYCLTGDLSGTSIPRSQAKEHKASGKELTKQRAPHPATVLRDFLPLTFAPETNCPIDCRINVRRGVNPWLEEQLLPQTAERDSDTARGHRDQGHLPELQPQLRASRQLASDARCRRGLEQGTATLFLATSDRSENLLYTKAEETALVKRTRFVPGSRAGWLLP
ncbi:hypothetical protein QYF61_013272 [Mycteria americana]|uniref:Uncharacterized protein n=1 Tax=Mycteria americana TaxID=33587 RepID=A0AAN7NJQ2_MYCAM|nr:hypothetical protein QYF61_013272 [Mycteria americana]